MLQNSIRWLGTRGALYSLVANELANTVIDLVGRVGSVAWSEGTQNEEHGNDDGGEYHELAEHRPAVAKLLPLHATLAKVLLELLSTQLVVDKTAERDGVTKGLEEGDGVLEEEHGREDKENVLEHTGKREDERRGPANLRIVSRCWRRGGNQTYQEDDRDVEQEGDGCVGEQGEKADAVHISHGHGRKLSEDQNAAVDDGARGGVVVERDEGVHLEVGAAEQTLNHDQADSLESDTGALEQETDHDELDLTHRGNDDTNDNERHVPERLEVDGRDTQDPGGDEDSDRHGGLGKKKSAYSCFAGAALSTYLEHLDKGHTEV